mmetsp:Transcript_17299/g.39000  ORF Transcript_17299/g.39000 Transcript_17299/m.39000 type:complete len:81 (-) Transcript_17299:250-492(-)
MTTVMAMILTPQESALKPADVKATWMSFNNPSIGAARKPNQPFPCWAAASATGAAAAAASLAALAAASTSRSATVSEEKN